MNSERNFQTPLQNQWNNGENVLGNVSSQKRRRMYESLRDVAERDKSNGMITDEEFLAQFNPTVPLQDNLNIEGGSLNLSAIDSFCSYCHHFIDDYVHHNISDHYAERLMSSILEKTRLSRKQFGNNYMEYQIDNIFHYILPEEFLKETKTTLEEIISYFKIKYNTFKFGLKLECNYIKGVDDDFIKNKIFHSNKFHLITWSTDINEFINDVFQQILIKMSEFQESGSGFALNKIIAAHIKVVKINSISGSHYIPLPRELERKGACVNVKNNDNFWCIIAALSNKTTNKCRCSSYQVDISMSKIKVENHLLNFENIIFPMKLEDINNFEHLNPPISVNVFGYNNKEVIGPYYLTKEEKTNHINLLLILSPNKYHYVLISDLSR